MSELHRRKKTTPGYLRHTCMQCGAAHYCSHFLGRKPSIFWKRRKKIKATYERIQNVRLERRWKEM